MKYLGEKTPLPIKGTGLDTFPAPSGITSVFLESDELTSICPVTGQPDFSRVEISFVPNSLCLESKSLKLYLWSFRNEGMFCEALACKIAQDLQDALNANWIEVKVIQGIRGGIKITAISEIKNT